MFGDIGVPVIKNQINFKSQFEDFTTQKIKKKQWGCFMEFSLPIPKLK